MKLLPNPSGRFLVSLFLLIVAGCGQPKERMVTNKSDTVRVKGWYVLTISGNLFPPYPNTVQQTRRLHRRLRKDLPIHDSALISPYLYATINQYIKH